MSKSFKIKDNRIPSHFSTLSVDKLIAGSVYLPSTKIVSTTTQTISNQDTTGILYSNSGVLLYKAPDGTITFIANS